MPVSKNKRKTKRGRRRKENLAKAATTFGGGGYPDQFDRSPQPAPPATTQPGEGSQEQASKENSGYSMNSALSTTRRVMLLIALIVVAVALLNPSGSLAQDGTQGDFTFDFETDAQGWTVGFADLPVDYDQSIYELAHEHGPLPDGLEGSGIHVQGHNRSDDLFMFLKRQVDGLRPDTEYAVSVSIDLATNVPAGLVGIGGSPGESVFVKAGASTAEPVAQEDSNRYLRMNIDKGNQARGGESMVVLGNVAHPQVLEREYRIKTLDNAEQPLMVSTDGEGRVWLIVGTDSGFEGLTSLYYARISYTLNPVVPPSSGGSTPTPEPTAMPEPNRRLRQLPSRPLLLHPRQSASQPPLSHPQPRQPPSQLLLRNRRPRAMHPKFLNPLRRLSRRWRRNRSLSQQPRPCPIRRPLPDPQRHPWTKLKRGQHSPRG